MKVFRQLQGLITLLTSYYTTDSPSQAIHNTRICRAECRRNSYCDVTEVLMWHICVGRMWPEVLLSVHYVSLIWTQILTTNSPIFSVC
jgi:hypothetical protein